MTLAQPAPHRPAVTEPELSVVIPTFNEAENLPLLVDALRDSLGDSAYELLVVDDDSPDGTWQVGEELAAADGRIRIIRRIDESGLSSAIIRGMREAAAPVIVVIDADLQHDESIIPQMVDEVRAGADVCVGSRKAEGGGYGEWSWSRRFVSWGATVIARTATGVRVSDPMSGFFAVDRDFFHEIQDELNPRGFKVLLEVMARGKPDDVAEVGYVFRERTHGVTKLNSGVIYEYLLGIIDLRLGRVVSSQAVTYLLVTFVGMVVNLLGYLGARVLDVDRAVSAVIGFELAVLATFVGNNSFTFRATSYRGRRFWRGLAFYQVVSLYGGLIQLAVFQLLREQPPFATVAVGGSISANSIAIVAAAVATYLIHIRFTWNRLYSVTI